jgi:prevent-host-death family protein
MTELRASPGERLREVWKHGKTLHITKDGKPAAKLVPVDDTIVVAPDGTIFGESPLTALMSRWVRNGGEY